MVSCSKQVKNNDTKNTSEKTTTSSATQADDEENEQSSTTEAVSLNENTAKDIVVNFYGKTFTVKLEEKSKAFAKYKVFDKMNSLYSIVTIDYKASIMEENIISTDEVNKYDLNSLNTED